MTPIFFLLFLIHIIVRLSPLILFLSMALGMLAATFMDIQNSVAYRPRGDFVLCKCGARAQVFLNNCDRCNRSNHLQNCRQQFKKIHFQEFII